MALTLRQAVSVNYAAAALSRTITLPNVLAGSFIVLWCDLSALQTLTITVTDNQSNTYTAHTSGLFGVSWSLQHTQATASAGNLVLTVTSSGSSPMQIAASEWVGQAAAAFDVVSNPIAYTLTTTTFTSPSITTTLTPDALVFFGISTATSNIISPSTAGYSMVYPADSQGIHVAENPTGGASTGTYSYTETSSSSINMGGWLAAIKAAPTFTVSGNAGVAGATVSYAGPISGSVVADGAGNYSIPNLFAASYTITPALPMYNFSPASQVATVVAGNVTGVNFTATKVSNTSLEFGNFEFRF